MRATDYKRHEFRFFANASPITSTHYADFQRQARGTWVEVPGINGGGQ